MIGWRFFLFRFVGCFVGSVLVGGGCVSVFLV